MYTREQVKAVALIVQAGMTKLDKKSVDSIATIHELARENYAVSIWSGVIGRHANDIATQTKGEVVIKTAKQREKWARLLIVGMK